ncbi:MAG: hypothetical protein Q7S36_01530 [Candidatus Liptonbacteria bacterium]|nr:hypothetical protein [Candidatus Liptonbacteria bacterium]
MHATIFAVLLSLSPGKTSATETPVFKTPEIPLCATTTGNPYAVCMYGTRHEFVNGEEKNTPFYAIVSKNTNPAEELFSSWTKHFGEYAMDGELYVHLEENSVEAWKVTAYHRPKNGDQTRAWLTDKTLFSEEKSGDKSILPSLIRSLPEKELAKVWYVVHYYDGSAKVYLQSGTTAGEASAIILAFGAK